MNTAKISLLVARLERAVAASRFPRRVPFAWPRANFGNTIDELEELATIGLNSEVLLFALALAVGTSLLFCVFRVIGHGTVLALVGIVIGLDGSFWLTQLLVS